MGIADRADSERFTLEPFKNRAGAVAWLDEQKLLVAKPAQPKPVEDMTAKELTEVKPELHPDAKPNGTKPVEPVTEQELLDRILNS